MRRPTRSESYPHQPRVSFPTATNKQLPAMYQTQNIGRSASKSRALFPSDASPTHGRSTASASGEPASSQRRSRARAAFVATSSPDSQGGPPAIRSRHDRRSPKSRSSSAMASLTPAPRRHRTAGRSRARRSVRWHPTVPRIEARDVEVLPRLSVRRRILACRAAAEPATRRSRYPRGGGADRNAEMLPRHSASCSVSPPHGGADRNLFVNSRRQSGGRGPKRNARFHLVSSYFISGYTEFPRRDLTPTGLRPLDPEPEFMLCGGLTNLESSTIGC